MSKTSPLTHADLTEMREKARKTAEQNAPDWDVSETLLSVARDDVPRLLDEVERLRGVLNGPDWHSHPGTDLQHGPRPVKRDDGLWWHQHPPDEK